MLKPLRLITATTSVLASLGIAVFPAKAATYIFLKSQPGDYVGGGRTLLITKADGQFNVSALGQQNGVAISFNGPGDQNGNKLFWYLDFAVPKNGVLVPGTYTGAARYPFQSSTQPGLSIFGDGRGCNTLTGKFIVKQVVFANNGSILHFAANFEQHCEGGTAALLGTVRYDAP